MRLKKVMNAPRVMLVIGNMVLYDELQPIVDKETIPALKTAFETKIYVMFVADLPPAQMRDWPLCSETVDSFGAECRHQIVHFSTCKDCGQIDELGSHRCPIPFYCTSRIFDVDRRASEMGLFVQIAEHPANETDDQNTHIAHCTLHIALSK
jgi:hypothetical protein